MTITAVLLAHYPERIGNIKRIVKDLQNGTRKPDEIIVFIDNDDINFMDDSVTVIRSSHSFPVSGRLHASSFATGSHIFLLDDDQTVEDGTIEHLSAISKEKPFSVLGFEGSRIRDSENSYTDGITINKGNEMQLADMIIRCWFLPKPVIGLAIYMHELNRKELGDKYNDDILICLANRVMTKHSNWCIPHTVGRGLIELGDNGVGQSLTPDHYPTRNKNCKFIIDRYQGQHDISN